MFSLGIPNLNATLVVTADDVIFSDVKSSDSTAVTAAGFQALSSADVPYFDRLVRVASKEALVEEVPTEF